MSSTVYSQRLGAISDAQLAAAVQRLGLGAFVSAAPVSGGLHGQNLFLTTTDGAFVLRGAPHWVKRPGEAAYRRDDRVQFTCETWFVDQLHKATDAPVPWPYLHDQASDIFGWPYVIMPRTPGACFNERQIVKALSLDDRRQIAAAAGAVLAELQRLTSPFSGGFDVDTVELTPDPASHTERMIARVREMAVAAEGVLTTDDLTWIEAAIAAALAAGERPNVFQHGDYKLDNMTVAQGRDGAWDVTGVFDFQTARFGDGAYDLVHMGCGYLDTEPDHAAVFVGAWRTASGDHADLRPWMPLYVAANRLMLWAFFVQPDARPAWSRGKTFRDFAEPYLTRLLALL